jgi:uncharacterized protein YdhG (YjbR/CyaY superfamily)
MATEKSYEGFSADEIAAMKERAAELKASSRGGSAAKKAAAAEQDCLDKIAAMPDSEQAIVMKLHEIAKANGLAAKTWYGMPAYTRNGEVVTFFKSAAKFKVRYAEVGFNEPALLDDGEMWPTAFAITAMNPEIEAKLAALVEKAAG